MISPPSDVLVYRESQASVLATQREFGYEHRQLKEPFMKSTARFVAALVVTTGIGVPTLAAPITIGTVSQAPAAFSSKGTYFVPGATVSGSNFSESVFTTNTIDPGSLSALSFTTQAPQALPVPLFLGGLFLPSTFKTAAGAQAVSIGGDYVVGGALTPNLMASNTTASMKLTTATLNFSQFATPLIAPTGTSVGNANDLIFAAVYGKNTSSPGGILDFSPAGTAPVTIANSINPIGLAFAPADFGKMIHMNNLVYSDYKSGMIGVIGKDGKGAYTNLPAFSQQLSLTGGQTLEGIGFLPSTLLKANVFGTYNNDLIVAVSATTSGSAGALFILDANGNKIAMFSQSKFDPRGFLTGGNTGGSASGTLAIVNGKILVTNAATGAVMSISAAQFTSVPAKVPEIDAGSASAALALLSGGIMMVGDRRRRRAAG